MDLSDHHMSLIEKYLADELSESERAAVEEKAIQSPSFSDELELQRKMIASIRREDNQLLREELHHLADQLQITNTYQKKRHYWVYAAASVIVIICTIFLLLPSKESLFASYYHPLPESPILRGETAHDSYATAMQKYSIGNYEEALVLLTTIYSQTYDPETELYIGSCLLSLRRAESAISYLENAAHADIQIISDHGRWYLALAYLDTGDLDQARSTLHQLSLEVDHMYQEKSKSLLKKMKWLELF